MHFAPILKTLTLLAGATNARLPPATMCCLSETQFQECSKYRAETQNQCILRNSVSGCMIAMIEQTATMLLIVDQDSFETAKSRVPRSEQLRVVGRLFDQDFSVAVAATEKWTGQQLNEGKVCSNGFAQERILPLRRNQIAKTADDCDIELTRSSFLVGNCDQHRLLCPDGSLADISQFRSCNFGRLSPLLLLSNSPQPPPLSIDARLLRRENSFCPIPQGPVKLLPFQIESRNFPLISPFSPTIRLCLSSLLEHRMCSRIAQARVVCVLARNWTLCGSMIESGEVDVGLFNSFQSRTLQTRNDLIAIANEAFAQAEQAVFAVAVTKRLDSKLVNLWSLRGKTVCSPGYNDPVGWISPILYLRQTGQIEGETLEDLALNAAEFFGPSCVPGSDEFTSPSGQKRRLRTLCARCYSKGREFCAASHDERFYGNAGAFRCLTEKNGDIAFVAHWTVQMNTNARNQAEWARHLRSNDFELLCRDGSRRSLEKWRECHLAVVPVGGRVAMISKGRKDALEIYELLSDLHKTKLTNARSFYDENDLIFSDHTQSLHFLAPS